MSSPDPTEQSIRARVKEIDESVELSLRSGDVTFFEAQWVNLSAAKKREHVMIELSGER